MTGILKGKDERISLRLGRELVGNYFLEGIVGGLDTIILLDRTWIAQSRGWRIAIRAASPL